MKTLNTLKISLLFVIMASMFASCSKDEIELVENGYGPEIEIRIETEDDGVTLSDSYDYNDNFLKLPLSNTLNVDLRVKDMGGISKVEVRTVKWEIIDQQFASDDIAPSLITEGYYKTSRFVNPISENDIVEMNASGQWEIAGGIPDYIAPFDRDLLITAIDRSGNTTELRIKVGFSNNGEIAIEFN